MAFDIGEDEKDSREVNGDETISVIQKIENAYKNYKLCEFFHNDVNDDYGKKKIARLRMEFAYHELMMLIKQAVEQGVKLDESEMLKKMLYADKRLGF